MESRLDVLAEYGFSKDPFAGMKIETTDTLRINRLITMAIDSRAMVSIVGARGYGKTESVRQALASREAAEVRVLTADKERISIGDIEREMILALRTTTEEVPRRSRVVRAHQLRRIMGEAVKSQKKNIVLILEESHRLHGQTLRSLKTLREMDWGGICPLFTVIMVGQFDPLKKPGVDEVRLRADRIEMKGLTPAEVKRYIAETVGRCYEDDAAESVSRLSTYLSSSGEKCHVRNFLELQELLCELMDKAMLHGHKKVRAIDVFSHTGGGLKELRKAAGLSLRDMADKTGVSPTEISLIENDKPSTITEARAMTTRNAVLSVVAKAMGEKKVEEEIKAGVA